MFFGLELFFGKIFYFYTQNKATFIRFGLKIKKLATFLLSLHETFWIKIKVLE